MVDLSHGFEDDGIEYHVSFAKSRYTVTVSHPDGRTLVESFICRHTPIFGPDVADVAEGEEIMERLIAELRK